MELPGAPPARTKRHWASQDAHHPRDPERHLLHPSRRLRLAAVAQRLSYSRKTVYHYFRFWCLDGTWERMHAALRKRVRLRLKRNPQPSAGMVDSQSAASRSRRPVWAAKSVVTTGPREGQRKKASLTASLT